MTIVQTIAQAHGGQAIAKNHPQGGADVSIRLPGGEAGIGMGEPAGSAHH